MTSILLRATLSLAVGLAATNHLNAKNVALFYNGTYVDTTREALYLKQSLRILGHNVHMFTGITAADWTTTLSGVELLVIPELEKADLYAAMSAAARTAIQSYVFGGVGWSCAATGIAAPRSS
jgi:hypothetical protein